MTTTVRRNLTRRTGPMGHVVWSWPSSDLQIMWAPGGGLFLGAVFEPGGIVVRIEHPSADGQYATKREAEAAVLAFLNA